MKSGLIGFRELVTSQSVCAVIPGGARLQACSKAVPGWIVILRRALARRRICCSSHVEDLPPRANRRSFDSGAQHQCAYAQDDN